MIICEKIIVFVGHYYVSTLSPHNLLFIRHHMPIIMVYLKLFKCHRVSLMELFLYNYKVLLVEIRQVDWVVS